MPDRARMLPRLDPFDPEVLDNPYPRYGELRDAGALCRLGPASFGVTRHADVSALLRDARVGSEFAREYPQFVAGPSPVSSLYERLITSLDPPEHTRIRRLVSRAFVPSLVYSRREHIERTVDRMLDEVLEREEVDIVADLALPLATTVMCELIGMPDDARTEIAARVASLADAFIPLLPASERATADDALAWLRSFVSALVEERRRVPASDLLTGLAAAEDGDDRLTHDEVVDNLAFLCFTGYETTKNLIANGIAALLEYPAEFDRLRSDQSLLTTAVDEFLRYDSPAQYTARLAKESIDIGGRVVKKGRVLVLLLGSANRDPAVFADPDTLDVGRAPNPHVAFGGGIHHCVGATLSRVEGTVVFARLLDRVAAIEPRGRPVRQPNGTFRCLARLPAVLRAA